MRLALAFLIALDAGAQVTAPLTPDVRAWKLPPISEFKLENGLTVDLLDDVRYPMVQVRLVFSGGSRRDPKDRPGLAAMVADTLGLGTSNETASQIQDNLGRSGGALSIKAAPDYIVLEGGAVPEGLPLLISVMSDLVRGAVFPEAELGVYAQGRRQAILRQVSRAGYAADQAFFATAFDGHPYSRMLSPIMAPATDTKVLIDYRTGLLTPANATLIAVGKLPARAQIEKLINDRFGVWQGTPVAAPEAVKISAPARRLLLIDRPGLPAAHIVIGKTGPKERDPEYCAMIVASMLANTRARNQNRSEMRIDVTTLDEASVLMALSQSATAKAAGFLADMISFLDSIGRDAIEPGALAEAKTAANSAVLMRLETQSGLADELAALKSRHAPLDFLDSYTARINAVSADQVREAAGKYLGTGNSIVVVEGDAARLQPELAKTGAFEIIKTK